MRDELDKILEIVGQIDRGVLGIDRERGSMVQDVRKTEISRYLALFKLFLVLIL